METVSHSCRGACGGWTDGYQLGFKNGMAQQAAGDATPPSQDEPIMDWMEATKGLMCCDSHACKLRMADALRDAYVLGRQER